jgi:MarR family transcriptional regulator for hemolysin
LHSLQDNFGALLAETARAWRNKLDQRLKPLGLSQAKWFTLLQLDRHGEGKTQKELAILLEIEGPTLVGLLDRLAHDGWIERREADYDRRAKTVHLQPKARELLRDINEIAASLRRELLSDITFEEIAVATRVLLKIKKQTDELG